MEMVEELDEERKQKAQKVVTETGTKNVRTGNQRHYAEVPMQKMQGPLRNTFEV